MDYGNNYNNYQQLQPQYEIAPSSVLVLGILSCAFSGILGIVFGCLGLSKAKKYIAMYGPVSSQVKIGKILSTIGIIVGIVLLFFIMIYAFVACTAITSHANW